MYIAGDEMFKDITINLDGPICKCTQDPNWGIEYDDKKNPCLYIRCPECKIKLSIPNKKFIAGFNYSSKIMNSCTKERKESARVLHLVPKE